MWAVFCSGRPWVGMGAEKGRSRRENLFCLLHWGIMLAKLRLSTEPGW